ncbi:MAG: LacI family transcriptional regulator [Ferruginibacter sp.]|nr:LacI family transcriptional regulator [Ferruginibacter sp.]
MNLKDLAKELNLSISSVSRALRDSKEISTATKKKVLAKAKELNYHANPFASNLRRQKSKTIAVVIPEIANNFFSLAINGAESYAQKKGFHVLIYQTHDDVQQEISIAKHLQNGRVDGVLISLSSQTEDTKHLQDLKNKGIPIVFFDRVAEDIDAPKITTNDYESGYNAAEHLIENGCKNIAFLSISNKLFIANNRMNGYLNALKKHGIKKDKKFIINCDTDKEKNNILIKDLLQRRDRPDAIFACVEELAVATYVICEGLKINIPNELKLISFSNLQTAEILNPALTTITQPAYEIGSEAASVLFKLLENKDAVLPSTNIVLKSTLIVRKSTKGK